MTDRWAKFVGNFWVRKSVSNTVTSNVVSENAPQPPARPEGRLLRFASPARPANSEGVAAARGGEGAGHAAFGISAPPARRSGIGADHD
jgi:hypothetical protein